MEPPTTLLSDLLTDDQVHQLTGIKPKTLANWRGQGKGPRFVKVGHRIRYRPEDIQAFIESRVYTSTSAYQVARKRNETKKTERPRQANYGEI